MNVSVLVDKQLLILYFEEKKSVALDDGTIISCDFNAKNLKKIREYIVESETLVGGKFFGQSLRIKKVSESEILQYLQRPEVANLSSSKQIKAQSEPSERLSTFLQQGVDLECSDLHIETYELETVIYARVDGLRTELATIPGSEYGMKLCSYIFNSAAKQKDGDFVAKDANNGNLERELKFLDEAGKEYSRNTRWRISYIPAKGGGKCTMRWLDASQQIPPLEKMGWTDGHIQVVRDFLKSPSGVALFAGKTGSGKTTDLASILSEITHERSVHTLEDPTEFNLHRVVQTQVMQDMAVSEGSEEKRGFNYYSKLTLRHDVDVEMHGEIREHKGAMEVARKGETGQLMFSTLHTSSAVGIAHTLIEQMNVPASVVAAPELMRIWVYQTLVRKLCPECCMTLKDAEEYYQNVGVGDYEKLKKDITTLCGGEIDNVRLKNPDGCQHCKQGESGRTAILEMIVLDDEDREFILKKEYLGWVKALEKKGYKNVRDHAISKIKAGIIDIETAATKVNDLIPVDSKDIYKTFEM